MDEWLILRCEDTLEGIFTVLYEAFVYRNRIVEAWAKGQQGGPGDGADVRSLAAEQISICIGEGGDPDLFAREIAVRTDRRRAEKTIHAIQDKLGFIVYQTLVRALCHFDGERGTVVFRYLVQGFQKGRRITEYLADPYVMRVMELARKVDRECEKLYGFLRFRNIGKFLYAEFAPKCNVLPLMAEHFADRYPNENFMIYDERRRYALLHPTYKECFYIAGDDLHVGPGAVVDEYEALWRQYFRTMEIRETPRREDSRGRPLPFDAAQQRAAPQSRHNEKCQKNNLPLWYRKYMTEFTGEMPDSG